LSVIRCPGADYSWRETYPTGEGALAR